MRKWITLLTESEDDPCWDGYTQYGMKKKGKKEVPNCVPDLKEEASDFAIETKPCPFCGSDEIGHTYGKNEGLAYVCMNCGSRGAFAFGNPEESAVWTEAEKLWNTRV